MVAGNSPNMPDSPFRSVTFLTTAIAKEMSYAGGLQRQALFSIALVLFVFIMIINVVLNVVLKGPSDRRTLFNSQNTETKCPIYSSGAPSLPIWFSFP